MSEEKREKVKKLRSILSGLSVQEREELARKAGILTVEGRSLSLTNQCLLALQCPGVTVVGGYKQWKTAGRQVKKGEHGHLIWFPSTKKDETEESEDETRFFMGTVFDIAQTDAVQAA